MSCRRKRRDLNVRHIIALQDNARLQTAALTQQKLRQFDLNTLFHIFGPLKKTLQGQKFNKLRLATDKIDFLLRRRDMQVVYSLEKMYLESRKICGEMWNPKNKKKTLYLSSYKVKHLLYYNNFFYKLILKIFERK